MRPPAVGLTVKIPPDLRMLCSLDYIVENSLNAASCPPAAAGGQEAERTEMTF